MTIKLDDVFACSSSGPNTGEVIKHRHTQKTVVFKECVPNLSNYMTSSAFWMPLKFSEGDTISLAYTLRLPYIEDSKFDSFVFNKGGFTDYYHYDQSYDFDESKPNCQMVYLGQVTIVSDKTFYKFLDTERAKLKWIPDLELIDKIKKAQYKDIRNLEKKIAKKYIEENPHDTF